MNRVKKKKLYIYKFFVVAILLFIAVFILKIAPNYTRDKITGKTNLVINNNKITNLKNDVLIDDGVIYISTKDIANFFDGNIYYDNNYDQIITTSNTKVATMKVNQNKVIINDVEFSLVAGAKSIDNQFYLPFSEIAKAVYNVETKYIEKSNTVVIVSLDRKLTYGNSSKNNKVKGSPTIFSKTVDKIGKGDTVTIASTTEKLPDGWSKITTENGKIGYVKENTIVNTQVKRENLEEIKQIEGKVSLVWDYFSVYGSAPQRTGSIRGVNVVSPTFFSLKKGGNGSIVANVGTEGINYINWAHSNGYKVWAMVSNDSMKDDTSVILSDYKLRNSLINNILNVAETYNLDGINIDFENLNLEDKDNFSRFIIELSPRLRDLGKVLSVDVTAPDGSENWSLCYDRNIIGKVADYIVFMAYDQHGVSSKEAGTVAGYNWDEANIKKFIEREEIDSTKIVLGIPFYTRIWTEENGTLKSSTIDMNNIEKSIPSDATKVWDDDLKQYYVEYTKDQKKYKIWVEDEKSIENKLDLVEKYNLAGAAYWEKDRETEDVWNIISQKLNIK